MKRRYFLLCLILLLAAAQRVASQANITQTFVFTGTMQSFTVPPCVTTITADVRGAEGGGTTGALGGLGGRAQAVFTVTPFEVLQVWVGGAGVYTTLTTTGGFNGGAGFNNIYTTTQGGTGGGGSDIRRGTGFANRIIVGGGGGGGSTSGGQNRAGGTGGGLTGGTGGAWSSWPSSGGGGGTQSTGGAAGIACCQTPTAGSFGLGGEGHGDGAAGCGGGGGWYGGGGGLFGGGGGGSSYVGYAGNTATSTTSGFQSGNGLIILTYNNNGSGFAAAATPSSICSGGSAVLSANGLVSYTWSTNSNASSITVFPSSSQAYTVQGTNSMGCVLQTVLNVTVNTTVPSITINSSTTSVCPNNTLILTASGAISYSWTGSITNGVAFAPPTTTNYIVTGANGCGTSTAMTTVSVTPLPVVAISSNSVICAAKPATLTAAGATSYTWSANNNQTGSTIVVAPNASATYTVLGVSGVCSGTAGVSINVNPNPTISATPASSAICQGSSAVLSASGGNNYTWTPGNMSGSSVTVSPQTNSLYVVTGDNSFSCTSVAQVAIIVNQGPTVTAVSNKYTVCPGGTATLTAGGAGTYSWSTGSTGNTTTVSPLPPSTTYTAYGVLSNGCASSKTITVAVFSPTLTVSPNTTVCAGSSVTLAASGASSYTWTGGPFSGTVIMTPTVATIYTLTTISTSAALSCSNTATVSVALYQLPAVLATATRTTICKGEKLVITASGASTYLWNNNLTTNTIQVAPISQTAYNVTGTDANGCTNTATFTVKISNCSSIEEWSEQVLNIYPNPSNGTFYITAQIDVHAVLYNELGQLIKTMELKQGLPVLIDQKVKGVYLLHVEQGEYKTIKRIIIE